MLSLNWSRWPNSRFQATPQPEKAVSHIAGASSPRLKQLRRLVREPKARAAANQFVVEGPQLLAEAFDAGIEVNELWIDAVGTAPDLVTRAESSGADVFVAPGDALGKALDTRSPRLVAAVARPRVPTWDGSQPGPVLGLVSCGEPGNVGTLMRTAEAAGFAAVALVGSTVDPTNPKVVRASAGAVFRLDIVAFADLEGLRTAVGDRPMVATVVQGGVPFDQADLAEAAIRLGNEARGLSASEVGRADVAVTIPLAGPTESLNVAAAGAVMAFESLRQRRSAS